MLTTSAISIEEVRDRIAAMDSMPSIPAIIVPLLRLLEVPPESVDVQRVVELVGHDKAIAAQTLHMANSPLFGRWQNIQTIRGAVVALGIARVRELATTCCMLNLLGEKTAAFDPRLIWEHSLGVALVSRRMARKIGYSDPEHAYLAGLLHDIGMIVNLIVVPEKFLEAGRHAFKNVVSISDAEVHCMGFDHAVTGGLLAEHWGLNAELTEVIRRHHQPDRAQGHVALVSLVNLADLMCRSRGLGYGYEERPSTMVAGDLSWRTLGDRFPSIARGELDEFSNGLDGYVREVRSLVSVLFRMQ